MNEPLRTNPLAFHWELAAEAITVRIRWFGVCMGYILVDVLQPQMHNRPILNGILALGAAFSLLDTIWSYRRQVFMGRWPLLVSLMEALFIGLLCHFDSGLESPFRFFYFLSLLVCAIRHSKSVTYLTFTFHAISLTVLTFSRDNPNSEHFISWTMMLVILGWVTWACTSLIGLLKDAGNKTMKLNEELGRNQEQLEERIRQRTQDLQESQALLVQNEKQAAFGLLAAGIAHEVGNPLAAISSLVQVLNRRPADDYTRERLQMVDDQLRRIQGTLRELVDFSRPTSKESSVCDLHEIVDAALNIAKYYKRNKGKHIQRNFEQGLPRVRVMRDQLVQVFLNLILNSMDATEEGGTVRISTARKDQFVEIDIFDDGHGISPQNREKIFDPYFTTKATGTGLGLFVCRNIIEQLGGSLKLSDTSPAGTTFTVTIALDETSGPAVPRTQENIPSAAEVGSC